MYKKIFSNSLHEAAAGLNRLKKKLGSAPGTVEYTGIAPAGSSRIHITDYDDSGMTQVSIDATQPFPEQTLQKRWIQISGLSDTAFIKELGHIHGIPPLVLEDIVNPGHAAKLEDCEDFLFIILKVPVYHDENLDLHFEHLSILLFKDKVISFQETDTFLFESLVQRLSHSGTRIRQWGCDYFVYAMIDMVVDTYAFLTDMFNEKLDGLEDEVMSHPHHNHVNHIHEQKRRIARTRKNIRPLRGIVDAFSIGDLPHVNENISPFIKDLRDHVYGVMDVIETSRESATMLMESYLSLMSHRMNEIMKVLTMMSAIFIPLGFVAGFYGMNFDYMPELHYRISYYVVITVMSAIAVAMMFYFKIKKWF